jgi:hypothetical protein
VLKLKQRTGADHLLDLLRQFSPLMPMQSHFAHQLLEARSVFGLPPDMFENRRVSDHEELSAIGFQLSA